MSISSEHVVEALAVIEVPSLVTSLLLVPTIRGSWLSTVVMPCEDLPLSASRKELSDEEARFLFRWRPSVPWRRLPVIGSSSALVRNTACKPSRSGTSSCPRIGEKECFPIYSMVSIKPQTSIRRDS